MPRVIKPGRVKAQITRAPRGQASVSPKDFENRDAKFFRDITGYVLKESLRAGIARNDQLIERRDRLDALEANNSFGNWNREYKQNLKSLQGKNAEGAYSKYQEDAEKEREVLNRGLSPRAQDYARRGFLSTYDSGATFALQKQESELLNRSKIARNTESQIALEDAVNNPTDVNLIANSEETLLRNVKTVGKLEGLDDKVITHKEKTVQEALHKAVVMERAKADPKDAMSYLKANVKKFDGATYRALNEEMESLVENQDIYDAAVAMDDLPLEKQLAKIDEIARTDVEKSQKVKRLVSDRRNEKKAVQEIAVQKRYEAEVDAIFQNPMEYKVPREIPAKEQEKLYRLKTTMTNDRLGKGRQTNWKTYIDLMSLPPEDLKKVNINDHVDNLSGTEIKELVKLQRKGGDFQIMSPYRQAKTAITGLPRFNVRDDDYGESASERTNIFMAELKSRIELLEPKERTEEKINEIIYKDLLAPVTYDPSWVPFNEETIYRFEVKHLPSDEDQLALYKEHVPENLQSYSNVKFHAESKRYYVDGDGIRRIFDRFGRLVKTYKHDESLAGR